LEPRLAQNKKVTINDYTSLIGNLLSVSSYDPNGRLIEKRTNHYAGTAFMSFDEYEERYHSQGVIEQAFTESRVVRDEESNEDIWKGVLSVRKEYPNVMLGTTSENFKTGLKSTSLTKAFDLYSGQPTEVLNTDAYGESFLSVTVPAYKKYPAMGLKVKTFSNKNMLSQGTDS